MILTVINLIGSLLAAFNLIRSMKRTHTDDACPSLIRFEWTYLATLFLMTLYQAGALFSRDPEAFSPSMLGQTSVWVSAFFFSKHLQEQYK